MAGGARFGIAWKGEVGYGVAGKAWTGGAWCGRLGMVRQARRGEASFGMSS